MDSCSSCRRPLDGALVCPGCGAYAPDIDPRNATSRARRPAAGTAVREKTAAKGDVRTVADRGVREAGAVVRVEAPAGGGQAAAPGGGQADEGEAGGSGTRTTDAEEELPVLHSGRAGRRLQLARWSRNRRRAAAATALALLGGGITVGTMASGSAKAPRTASAPDPAAPRPSAAPPTGADTTARRDRPDRQAPPSTPGALAPSAAGGHGPYSPYSPYGPYGSAAPSRRPPVAPWRTASGSVDDRTPGAGTTPVAPPTGGGTPGTTPPASPSPSPSSPHHLCILFVCLP